MRKSKGMSIMETAILIALIAVAAIGILTVFGSTIWEMLQLSSLKYKGYEPFGFATATSADNRTHIIDENLDIIDEGSTGKANTGDYDRIVKDPDPPSDPQDQGDSGTIRAADTTIRDKLE